MKFNQEKVEDIFSPKYVFSCDDMAEIVKVAACFCFSYLYNVPPLFALFRICRSQKATIQYSTKMENKKRG